MTTNTNVEGLKNVRFRSDAFISAATSMLPRIAEENLALHLTNQCSEPTGVIALPYMRGQSPHVDETNAIFIGTGLKFDDLADVPTEEISRLVRRVQPGVIVYFDKVALVSSDRIKKTIPQPA